jgi:hypothetical protein
MTIREKEILAEADKFADEHGFRVPYDGTNNFYDEVDVKASMDGFIAGAKWADKTVIEIACGYLDSVFKHLAGYNCGADYLSEFKKYMEEKTLYEE